MLADGIFAYLHFFGIGCLVAVLGAQTALLKPQMSAPTMGVLARIDIGLGISAILIIAAGAGRVIYGLKGPLYYTHNPIFWTKMVLFAGAGLASVPPTLAFIAWRKALAGDAAFHPDARAIAHVRRFIRLEWLLLMLVPLAAVLMTRGVGL
jgi:putative membrane protein